MRTPPVIILLVLFLSVIPVAFADAPVPIDANINWFKQTLIDDPAGGDSTYPISKYQSHPICQLYDGSIWAAMKVKQNGSTLHMELFNSSDNFTTWTHRNMTDQTNAGYRTGVGCNERVISYADIDYYSSVLTVNQSSDYGKTWNGSTIDISAYLVSGVGPFGVIVMPDNTTYVWYTDGVMNVTVYRKNYTTSVIDGLTRLAPTGTTYAEGVDPYRLVVLDKTPDELHVFQGEKYNYSEYVSTDAGATWSARTQVYTDINSAMDDNYWCTMEGGTDIYCAGTGSIGTYSTGNNKTACFYHYNGTTWTPEVCMNTQPTGGTKVRSLDGSVGSDSNGAYFVSDTYNGTSSAIRHWTQVFFFNKTSRVISQTNITGLSDNFADRFYMPRTPMHVYNSTLIFFARNETPDKILVFSVPVAAESTGGEGNPEPPSTPNHKLTILSNRIHFNTGGITW